MNTIIKRCSKKRKYIRKPLCANLNGICDFMTCRCGYADILDKRAKNSIRKGIDEDMPHRQKVIKRRREVDLIKLDNEIVIEPSPRIDWCGACKKEHGYDCPKDTPRYKGYTPPKKFNYWKIPLIIGLFGLVCLGYVFIISLIDIF